MKVCIASLAPFVGGAEIAAERLAIGLRDAGHEVVLLIGTRGPVLDRMKSAGLRCLNASMQYTDRKHWLRYLRSRRDLRRIIEDERPDILHSNDLPSHQSVSGAAVGCGIPRICHHRSSFDGPGIDWLNKFGAEKHLFVSHALKKDLCAASAHLKKSPCAVVHDGVYLPPLPDERARQEARRALGLPPDQKMVTFSGRIIETKGVADLLHAWSLLAAPLKNSAQLVLVGEDLRPDGLYQKQMQTLADELNCNARFVGFQPDPGKWLLASDIAVVPSRVEPFGLATAEAMAYALPVVATSVGGTCEIVEPDQTGLLVPLGSPALLAAALTRLLLDTELCTKLGRQGRQRCQDFFSLETHVSRVLQEYEQVLALGTDRHCASVAAGR